VKCRSRPVLGSVIFLILLQRDDGGRSLGMFFLSESNPTDRHQEASASVFLRDPEPQSESQTTEPQRIRSMDLIIIE